MEAGQIYVNASYIKSGTFVAGGANNQNGKIEIRNGSNQVSRKIGTKMEFMLKQA